MTQLQVVGLGATWLLYTLIGLGLSLVCRRFWHNAQGQYWQVVSGGLLLFGSSGAYVYLFRPPMDGLIIALLLAFWTGFLWLLGEKVHPISEWSGVTAKGNLKHSKLQLLEDAMSLGDEQWELLREMERKRLMQKFVHMALRYDGAPHSKAHWERMADEAMRGGRGE